MMSAERKAELLEWTKETLVPIREMAEGKPVERRAVLESVCQFVFVMGEMGLLDIVPLEEEAGEVEDRAATEDELWQIALNLAAEVRVHGIAGGHIRGGQN